MLIKNASPLHFFPNSYNFVSGALRGILKNDNTVH